VMMQAQQASLFLGRIPNPQSGKAEVLLEPAKLFIDQLEMIREKTRGNLTAEETEILNSVISDLEMAYVQASYTASSPAPAESSVPPKEEPGKPVETPAEPPSESTESKKKFSKSYGA
jgi:Domain of unknown function (DUF1844)